MILHDRLGDAVDPALERHHREQREQRAAERAEQLRIALAEQLGPHHREDVIEQPDQQHDRAHAGQRGEQAGDHAP